MLVRAISSVDDRGIADFGQMIGRTSHGVAQDNAIGRHRFQVARGIQQGLAFGNTGGRHTNIYRVGGKAFGRDFE